MASESSRTINGFLVFIAGSAALVGVAVLGIGLLGLTGSKGETVEQKRAAQRIATREKLEKEAAEKLQSIGWVDKAKGLVHVPIADAMALTMAELKAKKPAPSQVQVEPPLPMPPPPDPNATEPPPAALTSAPQGADTIRFAPFKMAPEATPVTPPSEAATQPPAQATQSPVSETQPAPPAAQPTPPVAQPVPSAEKPAPAQ